MKALVLEKRDGRAAVLCEDGTYHKTAQPCEVGETIELNADIISLPRSKTRWMRAAVAAVLALVLISGSYSYLATSACAYVSLDVGGTGVELSVNRLGRVISVSATNEASEPLASAMKKELRGKKAEDAMALAMDQFRDDGLLDGNGYVIAGVTSDKAERGEALTDAVEHAAKETADGDMPVYTFDVSQEERREAEEHDMSGGRFAFEQRVGAPDMPSPSNGGQDEMPTTVGEAPPLPEDGQGSAAMATGDFVPPQQKDMPTQHPPEDGSSPAESAPPIDPTQGKLDTVSEQPLNFVPTEGTQDQPPEDVRPEPPFQDPADGELPAPPAIPPVGENPSHLEQPDAPPDLENGNGMRGEPPTFSAEGQPDGQREPPADHTPTFDGMEPQEHA